MKNFRRAAAVLTGTLLVASMSFGATDYLLEIEGVEGDSRPGPQTLEVQSFSWGASNAGSMSAGSGGGAGKVSVQDLSRTTAAPRDSSSGLATGRRSVAAPSVEAVAGTPAAPAAPVVRDVSVTLPEAAARSLCATGKHIAKATLTNPGERVELENVVVSSCTTQAGVSVVSLRGHQKTGHVTLMK